MMHGAGQFINAVVANIFKKKQQYCCFFCG